MKYFLFIATLLLAKKNIAQNVGIGTTAPKARLHVADSSVAFTAPAVLPTPANAPEAPITGTGNRLMWYAGMGALRAGGVETIGWNKQFTGQYSAALGYNNVAAGRSSIALGEVCYSASSYATSFGYGSSAISEGAFASGSSGASAPYSTGTGSSIAAGHYSFSSGYSTRANAYGSFVAGTWNDITDNVNGGIASLSDRLFQVGNGSAANSRKNAFTILRNGNIGIGILNPVVRLQVADSSVVFTAPSTLPSNSGAAETPLNGAGNRMMWYADKAAFRSGGTESFEWEKNLVGQYSGSIGYNSVAAGKSSVAFGENNYAANNFSVSMGFASASIANAAFSSGTSIAAGNWSTGTGKSTATGNYSFSTGNGTEAKADGSFASGFFNDITDNPTWDAPLATDRIFQVGNGTGAGSRSNAITILRNGNMGIGHLTPNRPLSFPATLGEKILLYPGPNGEVGIGVYGNELRLHSDNAGAAVSFGTQTNAGVFTEAGRFQLSGGTALRVNGSIWANGTTYASDARFKKNISTIENCLEKILQLRGVRYEMMTDEYPSKNFSKEKQVGLLAQEVETVVPEIVSTGDDGYKSVDYAKLVPLLIESIKEQQQQIEALKAEMKKMKAGK